MMKAGKGFGKEKDIFGKKGQITVFIIIGIIILGGVGIYSAVRRGSIEGELSAEMESMLEEVPVEFAPADLFIRECVSKIAEEGIREMGNQGGFIRPSRYGISAAEEPTGSNAAKLNPEGERIVAYWQYLESPNNCGGGCSIVDVPGNRLFLYKKDGSPSIEGQLEEHINENLDACLDDFKALKEMGFSVEKLGEISTRAGVQEEEVLVLVEYPLEFSRAGKKELSRFFVRIPVNLKKIYELSNEVVALQGNYRYLENYLEELIVGFSGVKTEMLPPMHETIVGFDSATWEVEDVKNNLIWMLSSYIRTLKVSNTANYQLYDRQTSLGNAIYNSGMTIPVEGSYEDLNINLAYYPDWWGMYFNIDCDGTCRAESFSSNLASLFGMQRYSFAYDVSFPVEVKVEDPYAFNNRGYSFSFLMEANMRNNKAMTADYIAAPVIPAGDSGMCNQNNLNSGEITVRVSDTDGYEISDANVIYTRWGESCRIGKTENGVLIARFPPGLGGFVSVAKDGYLGQSQQYDIYEGVEDEIEFELSPLMLKNFVVRKRMIEKRNIAGIERWMATSRVEELRDDETAVILLEKIGEESEEEFRTGGRYNGTQAEPSRLRMGEGRYKADIRILLDDTIAIPAYEIEGVEIEAQELPEPYLSGGLIRNITLGKSSLDNSNTLVFYALSPNLYELDEGQRTMDDVLYAVDIDGYSKRYGYGARPELE